MLQRQGAKRARSEKGCYYRISYRADYFSWVQDELNSLSKKIHYYPFFFGLRLKKRWIYSHKLKTFQYCHLTGGGSGTGQRTLRVILLVQIVKFEVEENWILGCFKVLRRQELWSFWKKFLLYSLSYWYGRTWRRNLRCWVAGIEVAIIFLTHASLRFVEDSENFLAGPSQSSLMQKTLLICILNPPILKDLGS